MMFRVIINVVLWLFLLPINMHADIEIRFACDKDLPELLILDRVVSYEFFKPLWIAGYSHTVLGKNPDYYLEKDLQLDEVLFHQAVKADGQARLCIAHDTKSNRTVGLLLFHRENEKSLKLDLFMINKEYRGKGIGRKLLQIALTAFPNITTCDVYVLRFANENTQKFYQAMGFQCLGLAPQEVAELTGLSWSELAFHYRLNIVVNAKMDNLVRTIEIHQPNLRLGCRVPLKKLYPIITDVDQAKSA